MVVNYKITDHVVDRFEERFPEKFNSYKGENIKKLIRFFVLQSLDITLKVIANHSSFIVFMYDKYGSMEGHRYLKFKNMIFIVVINKTHRSVVTVVTKRFLDKRVYETTDSKIGVNAFKAQKILNDIKHGKTLNKILREPR